MTLHRILTKNSLTAYSINVTPHKSSWIKNDRLNYLYNDNLIFGNFTKYIEGTLTSLCGIDYDQEPEENMYGWEYLLIIRKMKIHTEE